MNRLWLALALAACAPDDEEPLGLSFERDVAPLFWDECDVCHRGERADAGLELWDDPYGAMVDVPSTQAPLDLVEPGDHLYSYVWHKINGTQSVAGGSGTAMPLDGLLSPEEVALVAAWIDAGAPP